MDPRETSERGNSLVRSVYQPTSRRQAILAMSTLIRLDATDIAPLLFAPVSERRVCRCGRQITGRREVCGRPECSARRKDKA